MSGSPDTQITGGTTETGMKTNVATEGRADDISIVPKSPDAGGDSAGGVVSFEMRIARFAVRRPYAVVVAVVAFVLVCAAIVALRIQVDSDILNLLPQRFDSVGTLKVYDREFTQARELTFGIVDESHTADMDGFVDHFGEMLRKEPWVVRVLDRSPMESADGSREVQTMAVPLLLNLEPKTFSEVIGKLRPDAIAQRFARKKAEMEAGSPKAEMELTFDPLGVVAPALKPLSGSFSLDSSRPLASPDGTLRVVIAATNQDSLDAKTCQVIMRKVEDFKKRVYAGWKGQAPEIMVTGRTAYVGEMSLGVRHDIISTVLGSVVLVAGVFYIGFRRFRPLLAILHVLLLCCAAAVAVGVLVFHEMNVITMGLCSILVGLGVDFGMLLYGSYQTHRNLGHGHESAAAHSVHQLGRGIVFGAITTAVAFLSLFLSESPGFAQLGFLIGIGILFAALFMMTVFFVFVGRRHVPGDHDFLFTATKSYIDLLYISPKPIVLGTLAVLMALNIYAFLPVGTVEFQANPRSLEPANSQAGRALRTITAGMRKAGEDPVEPVLAIIRGNGPEDFHTQWDKARERWTGALERGEIKRFNCPAAFAVSPSRADANLQRLKEVDLPAARKTLTETLEKNGFDAEAFKGAFTTLGALEALSHGDRTPLDLRRALPVQSIWRFVLDRFLSNTANVGAGYVFPNKTIADAAEQAHVRKILETPGVALHLSGWSYVMADLVPWSHSKLVELSVAMILFNIVLLVFMYRSMTPLLVLMISLGLSIGAMIAGLKITGLPLNLFNILSFPLVLGVGVDYGSYIVVAVRQAALETQSGGQHRVLASIVKPVLLSGLTTTAGFASLGLANNPALSTLGLVCALGVACCLFSTLFLILPTYLWRGYR